MEETVLLQWLLFEIIVNSLVPGPHSVSLGNH